MTLTALLIELRRLKVALSARGEQLVVDASRDSLTSEHFESLRQHKRELLELPKPFLTKAGVLIVPLHAPPQYSWLSLEVVLAELDAPLSVVRRYCIGPEKMDSLREEMKHATGK